MLAEFRDSDWSLTVVIAAKFASLAMAGELGALEKYPWLELAKLLGKIWLLRPAVGRRYPVTWQTVADPWLGVVDQSVEETLARCRRSGKLAEKESPMRWIVTVLSVLLSIGCFGQPSTTPPQAPDIRSRSGRTDLECGCPYEDAPYMLKCRKCGYEWCSSEPGEIAHCPNCPLQMCEETVGWIMALGTLNELARHQPGNAQVRQRQAERQQKLEEHCRDCPVCRAALGKYVTRPAVL